MSARCSANSPGATTASTSASVGAATGGSRANALSDPAKPAPVTSIATSRKRSSTRDTA